jgi:hypothetical protein
MDVRDLGVWASMARRHTLARRLDAYFAGLLPRQEAGTIRAVMDALERRMMDEDMIDEIVEAEDENTELIARAKVRKAEALKKWRAEGRKPRTRKRIRRL